MKDFLIILLSNCQYGIKKSGECKKNQKDPLEILDVNPVEDLKEFRCKYWVKKSGICKKNRVVKKKVRINVKT